MLANQKSSGSSENPFHIDFSDFDFNFDGSSPSNNPSRRGPSSLQSGSQSAGSSSLASSGIVYHRYFSKEFICDNVKASGKNIHKYETSDKIILPASSLHTLANASNNGLYVLRIVNPKTSKYIFVGISDFTAPERTAFVPKWIMEYLSCKSGDKIFVDAMSVPKVSQAKIKIPEELKDIPISIDLKSIIEFILRNHVLLFLGKKLSIKMFEKSWEFEIAGLKPANIGSIGCSDIQLDLV
jgi:hypothetical protein